MAGKRKQPQSVVDQGERRAGSPKAET